MGKGKGKLISWFVELYPGIILFEFKNLRYGRAKYFCKEISYRITTPTRILVTTPKMVWTPLNNKYKITYDVFW